MKLILDVPLEINKEGVETVKKVDGTPLSGVTSGELYLYENVRDAIGESGVKALLDRFYPKEKEREHGAH